MKKALFQSTGAGGGGGSSLSLLSWSRASGSGGSVESSDVTSLKLRVHCGGNGGGAVDCCCGGSELSSRVAVCGTSTPGSVCPLMAEAARVRRGGTIGGCVLPGVGVSEPCGAPSARARMRNGDDGPVVSGDAVRIAVRAGRIGSRPRPEPVVTAVGAAT